MMLSRKVCGVLLSVPAVGLAIWLASVALLDRIVRTGDPEKSIPVAARWIGKLARPWAVRSVAGLARSSSIQDRRRAARALEFVDVTDRPRILCDLANDEDPDTRILAVRSMASLTDECLDCLLDRYAGGDSGERIAIVRTLGLLGNHGAFGLLSALAKDDGYPIVQEEAIEALGSMGDEAIPILTAGLGSRRANVRRRSAAALSMHGAPALPALRMALLEGDDPVMHIAASALAKMGRPGSMILVAAMESDDPHVGAKAAKYLIAARDPGTFDALSAAVLEAKDEKVAKYAREALQGMPDVLALRLAKLLDDTDATVVARAARLAAAVRFDGSTPKLCQLLRHDDPKVRAECARALGKLRSKQAVPHLITLLGDVDFGVQAETAKALGRTRSEDGAEHLIRALPEAPEPLAKKIRSALAESGQASLNPMIQALSTNDLKLRHYLIDALHKTGSAKAIPALESLLPSADEETRAHIEEALKEMARK